MIEATVTYALLFGALYFEVFMLVSFLERHTNRGITLALPTLLPSVAIVVPCYNEEKTIRSTISSLQELHYPKDKLEIIIVDDGSNDATYARAQEFTSDSRIHVFHKENGGKHTAMNLALEHTRAELIGCLDADSIVEKEALLRIVSVFQNTAVAAVTPGIHVWKPQTVLQHMQNVEYRLSIFNRFVLSALGSAFITPGPFSVFRTDIVRSVGGWRHGHSTEDMEMALRMQREGFLIANAPNAIVHTSTPRTLPALFKQRVRWSYGFLRNAVDYRIMLGNRAYGNLGLLILPTALISIGTAIYFFVRMMLFLQQKIFDEIVRIQVTGTLPHFSTNMLYPNTSFMWFLVYISVALILVLISTGSRIGTHKHSLPIGTPLFILFYSFLAPLWLGTAVVRAMLKTGVNWK